MTLASQLTVDMIRRRKEVQEIVASLGKDYEAEVGPFRVFIRAAMSQQACDAIPATLVIERELAAARKGSDWVSALLVAACCDVIEAGR